MVASRAAFVLVVLLLADTASGHGGAVPLDFWGGFGPRTGRCQRWIGHAAASCTLGAWHLRRDCRMAEIAGTTCDRQALSQAIQQARVAATNSVREPICRATDVAILNFLDLAEARTDVDRSCRDTASGMEAAVFGRLDLAGEPTDAELHCVGAVADAATLLLGSAVRERARLLDRIALSIPLSPGDKMGLLNFSNARIDAVSRWLARHVTRNCGDEALASLYATSAEGLLTGVRQQVGCLIGGTYAQAAVVCDVP
jgi:hypothetical protein